MKIDKQKAKIDFLRDRYKNYFIVVIALLGSSIGILIQIMTNKIPIFITVFVLVGFLLSLFFLKVMRSIKFDIIMLIDGLEEV